MAFKYTKEMQRVNVAQAEIKIAMHRELQKHNLTYLEVIQVFTELTNDLAQDGVRSEREEMERESNRGPG